MQGKITFALFVTLFTLTFSALLTSHIASAAGSLSNVIVEPSNNLFSLGSHYVVGFTTGTTGTIKTFTITFPSGFNIVNTHLILSSGIGAGSISVAGQVFAYTVASAVSIPAGTNIIVDLGGIVNNAIASNTVSVTTKDALNNIIDGPTTSPTFSLKSVSTVMIGAGAVTAPKLAVTSPTATELGGLTSANLSPTAGITGGQLASGDALSGSVSIDSPTFAVDSVNHRVGIGVTSPGFPLDVLSVGSNLVSRFDSDQQSTDITIDTAFSDITSTSGINMGIGGGQKWFSGAATMSGSNYDYRIVNQQNIATPFTIDGSTNNVGIGTTIPADNLDVAGSAGFAVNSIGHIIIGSDGNGFARIENPGGGTSPGIFIGGTGDTNTGEIRLDGSFVNIPSGSFSVNNGAFYAASSGNVGIGTSSPTTMLQVGSGDISDKGAGNGIILKSPSGSCFKVTVSDTGAVTSTRVTCP